MRGTTLIGTNKASAPSKLGKRSQKRGIGNTEPGPCAVAETSRTRDRAGGPGRATKRALFYILKRARVVVARSTYAGSYERHYVDRNEQSERAVQIREALAKARNREHGIPAPARARVRSLPVSSGEGRMRGSLFAMSGRVCGENFSVLRSPSLSFFSPPSGSTGGAPSSCRRCSSPASPTRAACDTPPRLRSLAVHTCSERVLGASSQGRRLAQYGRYRFRPPCLCYALLLVCINCIRSPVELVRTAQSGAAKAVKIHLRRALHRRRRRQKGAPGNASARTFAPPSFACPCVLT